MFLIVVCELLFVLLKHQNLKSKNEKAATFELKVADSGNVSRILMPKSNAIKALRMCVCVYVCV